MSVRYRKVQEKRQGTKTYGMWYGRAVVLNNVTTKELAEEIAHSTTATYADTLAVLNELSVALRRHLLNSDRVEIEGIGAFKVGIRTVAAKTSADFGAQNVKGYKVLYQPFKRFVGNGQVTDKNRRAGNFVMNLLEGVTVQEAPKNFVTDKEPVTDPKPGQSTNP